MSQRRLLSVIATKRAVAQFVRLMKIRHNGPGCGRNICDHNMNTEFPWLDTLQGAAAVDAAARCGLLENLASGSDDIYCPDLLETLLTGAGVIRRVGEALVLTNDFATAWKSDSASILTRASFIRRAAADVALGLDEMIFDLPAFMVKSSTFRLFRYDLAEGTTPEHLNATQEWVDYVEALSRSESPHLVPLIALHEGDRVLEVGGNTGLMSEALINTYAGVTSRIMDLPAVCALGRKRRDVPGLEFITADARKEDSFVAFVGSVDVILFKSVLHDWPAKDVTDMLTRAMDILSPGGRIIICERGAYGPEDAAVINANTLANLVFGQFYRDPEFYHDIMAVNGFSVTRTSVKLDMMFHATTGTCP
jgi:SAM-dependent methyltransferase